MKTTLGEAQRKRRIIAAMVLAHEVNDKLDYAAKKVVKNIDAACKSHFEVIEEQIRDLHISYALTDKVTGALLVNDKNEYSYTPENRKKLNRAIDELHKTSENIVVEFEPFLATDSPRIALLSLDILEELAGILISPELVNEKIANLV